MTDKSDVAGLETTAEERAEVCRNLERGDWTGLKLAAMLRDFDRLTAALASERERAEKAERERDELQATFDLMWEADQRAIKAWQSANPGNDLIWPDRTKLTAWLLAERDALARRVTELEGALCFYAEPARYTPEGVCMKDHGPYVGPEADRGEHARAVLKKENASG